MNDRLSELEIVCTENLVIREAVMEDAPFIFRLLNSPTWLKYIGDRGIHELEDAEAYIEYSLIGSYRDNGFGLYLMTLRSNSEPIGLCGLLKRPKLDHPDLGFAIHPDYAGNGYTFEGATAILEYARKTLRLKLILAVTTEENTNSKGLLYKLGFRMKGPINFQKDRDDYLLFEHIN
jgi:RimJ/RimL family protein N-acetyltransferase